MSADDCQATACYNEAAWEAEDGAGYCDLHIGPAVRELAAQPDASFWCTTVHCAECGSAWDADDRAQHRCGSPY